MPDRAANHLDRSVLTLRPCDYARDPDTFGHPRRHPDWHIPAGGTAPALFAARRQHELVRRWKAARNPKTGEIRARYLISKQVWSQITLGRRWAGQLGLEALLAAAARRTPRRPRA